eukprot:gene9195-22357_t
MMLVSTLIVGTLVPLGDLAAPRVVVEQFGMAQCPMTSTWQYDFFHTCIEKGTGIKEIVNYTLNMVGGTHGGPVTNTTWNSSFHGNQEIVADKYQLCAKDVEANPFDYQWDNFTACFTGDDDGIGICTLYGKGQIDAAAEKCALQVGMEWATLRKCTHGARGNELYYNSVWYTSDQGIKYTAPGIPVIRIDGTIFKGPEAYAKIGEHICGAYKANPPAGCGCGSLTPPDMAKMP